MSHTPHTPGPLQVILREQGTYNVERVSDGIRSVVAICYDSLIAEEHSGSAYGNALLFAAAPKLVAALVEGERVFRKQSDPAEEVAWLSMARAALALVKGN